MEESASLLPQNPEDSAWVTVRVPCTGLRHFSGISSKYSNQYPSKLANVITKTEFVDIIDRLNDTIADYWPCNICYYFGYACCLCSFGLSVCIPNYCATYSELYATAFLRNVSLKARYFDKRISFTLVKGFCNSYVEVKFPASLSEGGGNRGDIESNNFIGMQLTAPSTEIDLSNVIITSVPSATAFMGKERLKKS